MRNLTVADFAEVPWQWYWRCEKCVTIACRKTKNTSGQSITVLLLGSSGFEGNTLVRFMYYFYALVMIFRDANSRLTKCWYKTTILKAYITFRYRNINIPDFLKHNFWLKVWGFSSKEVKMTLFFCNDFVFWSGGSGDCYLYHGTWRPELHCTQVLRRPTPQGTPYR
jgi:hypothetical protein